MIKLLKHISLFALALIFLLGNLMCDKDESSPKLLLTGKQWKLTAWTSTPPYEVEGEMITNIYTLLPDCALDDFTVFNTDGTFDRDEAEIKCNESNPQTITGNWLINSNQTILKTEIEGSETEYLIIGISDDFLILNTQEIIDRSAGSVTYEYKMTYTRM
jgi:hypothetical protein